VDAANQRDSVRIDEHLEAEVFVDGRVIPCSIENLSAGGARIHSIAELQAGQQCTLGIRLPSDLQRATGLPYVSFHLEVLESEALRGGLNAYRTRNLTGPGNQDYEEAAKLVFAMQRRILAASSGADESSPMVGPTGDASRRRRRGIRGRFGRGSLRPGSSDK
jgi:hypothetical protein